MARKRDYKAEYQRRLQLGRERGLTKSQARGHARARKNELSLTQIRELVKPLDDRKLATETQKRLRASSLRQKRAGQSPVLAIPDHVLDQLSHSVRQFIFGY